VAVEALYVGGSLATGDYRPGVSDLDVVAIITERFGDEGRRGLEQCHWDFERRFPSAAGLHCIYAHP
jgi:predicted nucleotidyltransferase